MCVCVCVCVMFTLCVCDVYKMLFCDYCQDYIRVVRHVTADLSCFCFYLLPSRTIIIFCWFSEQLLCILTERRLVILKQFSLAYCGFDVWIRF